MPQVAEKVKQLKRKLSVRLLVSITSESEVRAIQEFYRRVFDKVDEDTPLRQSFDDTAMADFLSNPDVVKVVATDPEGLVIGLGMITSDIGLEPLLSPLYFQKHYPGIPVWYVLTLAIDQEHRGSKLTFDILNRMLKCPQKNAIAVFAYSKLVNTQLPRYASIATRGKSDGVEIDSEGIFCCWWKE